MKILALYGNTYYYGHERSNIQVFHTLKEIGLNVHVLINKKGIAEDAEQILKQDKISYDSIIYPDWSDMRKPFTFIKTIRYFKKVLYHNIAFINKYKKYKPDFIYIANDFMYINLIPCFIFCKCPIIYRIGDAPTIGWKPFNFFWRKYIIHRTSKFVYISKFIQDKVKELGRDTKHDMVIYNYPPLRNPSITTIDYTKKGITFGYLGQIMENKGVGLFLEAAKKILKSNKNIYFLIAGDLDYDLTFTEKMIKITSPEISNGNIIFLGPVQNLEDFFAKIDVLVVPSIKEEPLGNVIVEAKLYKVPAIIFPSGGMPELIVHKEDGYICNNLTAYDIQDAMEYYIKSPELIKIHSISAYNSIEKLQIGYEPFKENWKKIFSPM